MAISPMRDERRAEHQHRAPEALGEPVALRRTRGCSRSRTGSRPGPTPAPCGPRPACQQDRDREEDAGERREVDQREHHAGREGRVGEQPWRHRAGSCPAGRRTVPTARTARCSTTPPPIERVGPERPALVLSLDRAEPGWRPGRRRAAARPIEVGTFGARGPRDHLGKDRERGDRAR